MVVSQQRIREKLGEKSSAEIASAAAKGKEAMNHIDSPFTRVSKTLRVVFAWISGSERKARADAYRAYTKTLPDNVIGSMSDVRKLAAKGIYLYLKNGARIDRL